MEIELKLVADQDALQTFEQQILPKLEARVTRSASDLFNDYYDTPDQFLGQRKMGCRVRTVDGHIEQTIKTQGKVEGGLHQRPEFNVDLDEAKPDLERFERNIWADDIDVEEVNRQLTVQFSTHFHRVTFDIQDDENHLELVFDTGQVKHKQHSVDIGEIEIELKRGSPSSLFDLADEISKVTPVRLSNVTKAARGYQLMNGTSLQTIALPKFLALAQEDTTEDGFCKAIECGLSHWQHHEYVYLQTGHHGALREIAQSVQLLLQAVSLYLPVLQCQELLNLHKQLLLLSEQWSWQEDLQCIRKLRSKKGPFCQRIPKNQSLMSYLKGRREGLLSVQSPEQLLASMESSQVQLGASRLLIERPWQTQATGHNIAVLKHARGWLSQGWQTVMQSLPPKKGMDFTKYITLEVLLRQTLMNGFMLADLFTESRGKFRAPWLDLIEGIDEIKALLFLRGALEEVDIEDSKELQGWIDEKLNAVINVMEKSRKVAMNAEVYWS
ncbi:CYTH domain-containing protein [Glaciecola sp. MH2013]|uniref:CYTH domain-containing protein n=1 Tax=Glaciecola sp. MH2013 TaxID=2785524 RepID=UPI00189D4699|nr:CYTH domain-containing protein [Glaciecola sp. MH2013]MBF7071858.1 CYTH domain-containing protein [Glaciecola sp. MH2013]